jgi:branched-chain amino acid transport system permease protein
MTTSTRSPEPVAAPAGQHRPPSASTLGRLLKPGAVVGVIVLAALLPTIYPSPYLQGLMVLIVIYAINGVGYDIQLGFAGMFNMGQALIFGSGSYTVALICSRTESTSILLGLAAAAVVGMAFGGLMGIIGLRTEGPQFAMISLGIAQIVLIWVQNAVDITRGPLGISLPSYGTVSIFGHGFEINTDERMYYVGLTILVLLIVLMRRILRSRVGSSWLCVRENVELARSQGVSPFRARLSAVLFSSAISAIAGGLLAYSSGFVSPDNMSVTLLVGVIVIVIVGGRGSLYGAILGAILFVCLPEALRGVGELRLLVFGAVLALGVVFVPNGLWSLAGPIRGLAQRVFGSNAGQEARG